MEAVQTYKKGGNEGGLLAFENGTFEAFTACEWRKFKTEKGAKNGLIQRAISKHNKLTRQKREAMNKTNNYWFNPNVPEEEQLPALPEVIIIAGID